MTCAGCGHPLALHGRRGFGACRHGHVSPLAAAVAAVEVAVRRGLSKEETHELVERAHAEATAMTPCKCKRARKTPIKEAA